jgi:hypothetical protein
MTRLFSLLFLFLLTTFAYAQSGGGAADSGNSKKTVETKKAESPKPADMPQKTDTPVKTPGRIVLPPEKANPVRVAKFDTPPVIDGRLDDEAWQTAPVLKDFYQTHPGDNIAPSKPTEVMIGYDEKNLYIAFKCYDERDKIRATVAKRDDVFGEDNVRVWLDTYDDQRRAYVLGFNPLGIQQDGIHTEGRGTDFSIDIVMESKGVIEEWGWSVEVKIPFKSLRYVAGKGKLWGFNVARNIDRFNDEMNSWMPDDRNISGSLIKHGKITGLDEIKTERTLEIVPSITLSETGRRIRTQPRFRVNQLGYYDPIFNPAGLIENGRFLNQPIKQDIGVTMKLGIMPNITLDAAINPDFAEIEADAPVVAANQRFPIFFQEKRPFFLEGAEIFQSPLQVFYSRTIVDPDLAAKLTGKIGKTSFGFLAASDKAPGNYDEDDRNDPSVRPRIDEFLDKNALFGVLRLKRDFGKENNVGFFGTFRSFPEQKNLLSGFDGRFKLDDKTVMQFQVVGTHSRRCFFDAGFEPSLNPQQRDRNRAICGGSTYNEYCTGNGLAYFANYDYTAKNYGYVIEFGGRSKDYRADAGFTRRTNTNYVFSGFRLSSETKPQAKIIRANWFNNLNANYNWQGHLQSAEWGSNLNFNLQGNTSLNFNGGIGYERIFEGEFGLKRMPSRPDSGAFAGHSERSAVGSWLSASFNKQINKKIRFGVFAGTIFNAFDYDFGGGSSFPRVSPGFVAYQSAYDEYVRRYLINPNDPTNIQPVAPSQLDPGTGQQYDFGASGEYKPITPLRISLSYNKSKLVREDTGLTAFDSNILTLRSTYQFSRFVFVRARWDYDSLRSNFSGQMLFGWNPNPGTAFYVGYNDNFNYNGFNPFTGNLEPRFERNSRTFFIRASYLFRKSF